MARILVVEDQDADFRLLVRHLQRANWPAECVQAANAADLDAALSRTDWQVVLVDYMVPGLEFGAMLRLLGERLPDVPVILVSSQIGEEAAVDWLREGLADFVLKDRPARLVSAIERSLADVAQRRVAREAARALADSEAWKGALLESLIDGLFVAQDERFVFTNAAMTRMLGYPPGGLEGRHFSDVLAPAHLSVWTERFRSRVSGGGGDEPLQRYDVQFLRSDGQPLWIELGVGRLAFRGRYAALGVVRDVSERHRMTAELDRHRQHLETLVEERTRKAEAASRAKSAFLANMSHEIRTPLNTVRGLTRLLRSSGATPGQAARLDQIDDAARHLLSVIDAILDLSKIEAGHLELASSQVAPGALLDQVATMVGESARAKGLGLHIEPVADLPLWLAGDETRLRQALLNLAANAVKFTERGQVRLAARLEAEDDAACVLRFEVADTGIGVEPDVLPRLFQAFEQADASTTRRYGGTGLGLAITRQIAERMGGRAGASSRPGEGSTFWFSARLARTEPPQAAVPAADLARARLRLRRDHTGARVLLAEDHPVNREVAAALLADAGLAVEAVGDGEQALAALARGRFDAVILDMQMPRLDGLGTARAIRAQPALQALPVIAMTANAFVDDREACRAAGMDDFVAKPVEPELLYATLLRWLDARRQPIWQAVAGIDSDHALRAVNGNAALLQRVLDAFSQTHADDVQALPALMAAGDWLALGERLHSLRGAAGALGALALARQVAEVEAALATGGGADEVSQLAQALGALLAAIDAQRGR